MPYKFLLIEKSGDPLPIREWRVVRVTFQKPLILKNGETVLKEFEPILEHFEQEALKFNLQHLATTPFYKLIVKLWQQAFEAGEESAAQEFQNARRKKK